MAASDFERAYDEARQVLQEWTDKQGHERCWYYPDLFRRLANIFGVVLSQDAVLPPREEFKRGCERYQAEEYRLSVPEQGTNNQ